MNEAMSPPVTALTVAAIAAVAAVVGGATSAILSFIVGARQARLGRDRVAIEYLNQKISTLQRVKDQLDQVRNMPVADLGDTVDRSFSIGVVVKQFRHSLTCFQSASYYLEEKTFGRMSHRGDLLKEAYSYFHERSHGLIQGPEQWTGREEAVLEDQDLFQQLSDFPLEVAAVFTEELRRTAARIEHIIGL
ncbi:MAG: hypothetical protein GY906_11730 [bacterium]|nr:hypothetical protein [bacterium]